MATGPLMSTPAPHAAPATSHHLPGVRSSSRLARSTAQIDSVVVNARGRSGSARRPIEK